MKDKLREMFAAILPALDPGRAVLACLRAERGVATAGERVLPLRPTARVRLIAIGKAAQPMARAALAAFAGGFGGRVEGVVVAPHGSTGAPPDATDPLARLTTVHAGHPVPDAASLHAAQVVRDALVSLTEHDLVVFLLSGGGSALCEAPLPAGLGRPAITLADVQAFHRELVGSGLDIVAMNTLRKHVSAVKGGRLAQLAAPAAQVTLLVADVPPQNIDAVASGPSMPDPTSVADCRALLARCDLDRRLPPTYLDLLRSAALPETAKPGDAAWRRSSWHVLLDTSTALHALRDRCLALGLGVEIDLSVDEAPVEAAAIHLLRRLRAAKAAQPQRTVAVLTGGELSCPVTGPGTGGRNQHFALHCALRIEGEPITVLSAGTDGIDGNSPAAGAIADGTTCARARARGLDPRASLARCDSFPLFAALGDALVTGPTGTNVRDVRVLVM